MCLNLKIHVYSINCWFLHLKNNQVLTRHSACLLFLILILGRINLNLQRVENFLFMFCIQSLLAFSENYSQNPLNSLIDIITPFKSGIWWGSCDKIVFSLKINEKRTQIEILLLLLLFFLVYRSIFKLPKHKKNLGFDLYIEYKIKYPTIMVCNYSNVYRVSIDHFLTIITHKFFHIQHILQNWSYYNYFFYNYCYKTFFLKKNHCCLSFDNFLLVTFLPTLLFSQKVSFLLWVN